VAARDPNSDGLMVILTPQDMTDPTRTAEALKPYANLGGKPILASWMGGASVTSGISILNRAGIPTFEYPDTAVRLFNHMWHYSSNLRSLYETPEVPHDTGEAPDRERVKQILEQVRAENRTILTEYESKAVLGAYRIPITPLELADNPDDAVAKAEAMGYPVVLKLNSQTVTHKLDVGGVQLNITNADEVRAAYERIREGVTNARGAEHFQGVSVQPMVNIRDGYELIVGSSIDPQFGPVLLFGSGGTLVEVFKDRALSLPPLTTTLARRMMEGTKIYEALQGVRGRKPIDISAIEKILVRFSQMIVEQPWIAECDINPLVASPDRIIALDGRVVLHPVALTEDQLPQPAIRPYPAQYVESWNADDDMEFTIRPIRPEDEPLMVRFHETLSERTVQLRYFSPLNLRQRTDHERLSRIVFIDYDREMALVAERTNPKTGDREIAGVGRLTKSHASHTGEFGVIVSDKYQGKGIGRELLRRLIDIGRDEKLAVVKGYIQANNTQMMNLAKQNGFTVKEAKEGMVEAELLL
jgi:acetyltransferase